MSDPRPTVTSDDLIRIIGDQTVEIRLLKGQLMQQAASAADQPGGARTEPQAQPWADPLDTSGGAGPR